MMIDRVLVLCGLVAMVSAGCSSPVVEEAPVGEWRQFRGPEGLGVSREEGLPVSWKADSRQIRWRAPVPGAGNSSPVVSGDKVFLTTAYGKHEDGKSRSLQRTKVVRVVLAYALDSGEKLWETPIFEGGVGKRHWSNTHAAPTPVTDGRHLFVVFDSHLAALDFDGNVLWHREIEPDYYQYSSYGMSTSPVLAGDAVVLMQDREEDPTDDRGWLAAFDKRNGDEIWRDEWDHTCCSYSTPLVVERNGRLEVWNQTGLEVIGYDARNGEKLWRGEHPSTQTVPSLSRVDDLVVAPGGMHTKSIVMFHFCPGEMLDPVRTWSSRKGVPEIASPVLYLGKLYGVTRKGAIYAWEVRTGELAWSKRLPPGEYRASLVAGDGKVYASSMEGMTTVIDAAGEKPVILSRNDLGGGSGATAAISDGAILIRTSGELVRIDGRGVPSTTNPPPSVEPSEDAA
jgi:outer membrane protein assembly factor BamB